MLGDLDGLRIRLGRSPAHGFGLLVLFEQYVDGKRCVGELTMREAEAPAIPSRYPTVFMEDGAAQSLADDLWDAGIRPRGAAGSAGQLEAVQAHLADMQKLAARLFEAIDQGAVEDRTVEAANAEANARLTRMLEEERARAEGIARNLEAVRRSIKVADQSSGAEVERLKNLLHRVRLKAMAGETGAFLANLIMSEVEPRVEGE